MRREKGITLIALIITIVVMLILVAVSVNVIIKSNLIGTAEKTVDKYKTASEEESNMSQIEINGKKYDSIEDYLAGVESIPEIHNWVRTGDNIKCEHCNTSLTIGQKVNYTKTGTGSSSISEEKSGIAQAKADEQSWATSYGVQTVNIASDDTKWVVLGVEDSNKNGTNETLLLTTETPTTETIRMYGYQPYNYAIDEINRMCKEIYGAEARGMTIEDVNACLQYVAPEGMCAKNNSGTIVYYTVPEGTKISDLGSSYGNIWTDIQNNARVIDGTKKYFTPSCPEGTTDSSVLGNIPVDGYFYVVDSTVGAPEGIPVLSDSTTNATKNLIFGDSNNYFYWLASRGVRADSVFASFGPGAVDGGFARSYNRLFISFGVSVFNDFSLRAVVSLRSDIPAVVE
jgi:hypothetical protein